MRGESGDVFPLRVFSKKSILIQADKTRICLILLQACTLNYSRRTLVYLSVVFVWERSRWCRAPEPTVVNSEWLSPDPTASLNSTCGESWRKTSCCLICLLNAAPIVFAISSYICKIQSFLLTHKVPDQMAEPQEARKSCPVHGKVPDWFVDRRTNTVQYPIVGTAVLQITDTTSCSCLDGHHWELPLLESLKSKSYHTRIIHNVLTTRHITEVTNWQQPSKQAPLEFELLLTLLSCFFVCYDQHQHMGQMSLSSEETSVLSQF